MENNIRPEVKSEILSAAIVDTTSDIVQLKEVKNEFSFFESNSYGRFGEHAAGSVCGTNLKLEIDKEVKPEVTSEASLAAIVNSTSHVSCPNEVENEFSFSELHPYGSFEEHVAVEQEDIQSLDLQIKSEIPDPKWGIITATDDDYIKREQLVSEELHIKSEESIVDQTIKTAAQVEHFSGGLSNFKIKLKRHLKNHTKAKPFQCNVCDYSCKQNNGLQRHVKTHTGEKPFQCNICDYNCIRRDTLQQHIKIHTGVKPFKCNICDYSFIRKTALQRHMKTHTGEKPFQCNICDYKCVRKSMLEQHMKTHTNEKPFQCNICDYKCIQKGTLEQHIAAHTAGKPFQCSICNFRCLWKSNLAQHMRIHTGVKSFKCNICDYKCIQKSYLKRHVKTHRGKNTFSM